MARPALVLVDPNDGRRQSFAEAYQRYFDTYAFAEGELAISAATTMRCQVVVIHMEQQGRDGLALCRQLRGEMRGRTCLVVVHGEDPSMEGRAGVAMVRANHAADLFLGQEVEPTQLVRATVRRISGMTFVDEVPEPVSILSARRDGAPVRAPFSLKVELPTYQQVEAFFHRLDDHLTWESMSRVLFRPRTPVVDHLPHPDQISWRDVLLARPSLRNMRVLLSKPVTPLVRELPQHRMPTLAEVLRAEVNRQNLGIILRLEVPVPGLRYAA